MNRQLDLFQQTLALHRFIAGLILKTLQAVYDALVEINQ